MRYAVAAGVLVSLLQSAIVRSLRSMSGFTITGLALTLGYSRAAVHVALLLLEERGVVVRAGTDGTTWGGATRRTEWSLR